MATPVLAPRIDYGLVSPLDYAQTVSYINNFVFETAEFLNKFASLCDRKLEKVSSRMQQLEISMAILEAKLESIPDSQLAAPPSQPATTQVGEAPPPLPSDQPDQGDLDDDDAPAAPAEPSHTPIKDHPTYAKYFKMLRLGVHEQQIKMKMEGDGLDPSILDDPEAPAPAMPSDDSDEDWD
eukprot:TRINITY_DN42639_c0_g1_i1.p1 TRINITY_DN42639_c0_g1~~TRINITY_DN42639_c0_g1_i1.p1  ORF type:complete len:181 (+),score=49.16 TRINITY_DN42639_c0_g1_i1:51-593(+)